MKTNSVIIIALLSAISLSSNELSWVDTQVEAIKPPRHGISNSTISMIDDPFIFLKRGDGKSETKKSKQKAKPTRVATSVVATTSNIVVKKKSSKGLVLSAIMNKSALINGEWYKLNDTVSNYKLSVVKRTSVVLTKGKKKLVLSTNDKKRNLKFK